MLANIQQNATRLGISESMLLANDRFGIGLEFSSDPVDSVALSAKNIVRLFGATDYANLSNRRLYVSRTSFDDRDHLLLQTAARVPSSGVPMLSKQTGKFDALALNGLKKWTYSSTLQSGTATYAGNYYGGASWDIEKFKTVALNNVVPLCYTGGLFALSLLQVVRAVWQEGDNAATATPALKAAMQSVTYGACATAFLNVVEGGYVYQGTAVQNWNNRGTYKDREMLVSGHLPTLRADCVTPVAYKPAYANAKFCVSLYSQGMQASPYYGNTEVIPVADTEMSQSSVSAPSIAIDDALATSRRRYNPDQTTLLDCIPVDAVVRNEDAFLIPQSPAFPIPGVYVHGWVPHLSRVLIDAETGVLGPVYIRIHAKDIISVLQAQKALAPATDAAGYDSAIKQLSGMHSYLNVLALPRAVANPDIYLSVAVKESLAKGASLADIDNHVTGGKKCSEWRQIVRDFAAKKNVFAWFDEGDKPVVGGATSVDSPEEAEIIVTKTSTGPAVTLRKEPEPGQDCVFVSANALLTLEATYGLTRAYLRRALLAAYGVELVTKDHLEDWQPVIDKVVGEPWTDPALCYWKAAANPGLEPLARSVLATVVDPRLAVKSFNGD